MNVTEQLPIVTYTPESQLRSPLFLARDMWKDVKASRELAWRLFVRDISARYRQSFLGIFWTILAPVITGTVFILLQSRNVINLGETDIPYPVFAFVGITLWQVFTESLSAPMAAVNSAKPMLAKINFPREALLLAAFYGILFNITIKFSVLAIILIYFKTPLTWGLVAAPFAVLAIIMLGMTIGLLVTPLGVLYTDVGSALSVGTQLLFFATPAVYPVPQSFPFSLVATLNPVAVLLIGARDLITKGLLLNVQSFLIVCTLTLMGLFFAWLLYRISLPIIIERMSA